MTHVVVLGAGRVGGAMAKDLAPDFKVTVADRSEDALARMRGTGLATRPADLATPAGVKAAVADADLVVGAVPGFMGFATARAVLEAGKTLVDISFFDEDCFELDELAKAQGLTAIVDCGVAPGCGNIILGDTLRQWDHVDSFECLVGGLPAVRTWPYEYKAGFSPIDVIEEYTRPARYVKDGRTITMPALSEPELLDFEGLGTLESFNTDGLRSLIRTFPQVPDMKEKTLRYPGHIEKMRMLRELGFCTGIAFSAKGISSSEWYRFPAGSIYSNRRPPGKDTISFTILPPALITRSFAASKSTVNKTTSVTAGRCAAAALAQFRPRQHDVRLGHVSRRTVHVQIGRRQKEVAGVALYLQPMGGYGVIV